MIRYIVRQHSLKPHQHCLFVQLAWASTNTVAYSLSEFLANFLERPVYIVHGKADEIHVNHILPQKPFHILVTTLKII
jgi:hypothetical protein